MIHSRTFGAAGLIALSCIHVEANSEPSTSVDPSERLRRMAAELEAPGSLSPALATLSGVLGEVPNGFSADQTRLARRIDEVGREILRNWLLRDLDSQTPPSRSQLAARLGGDGEAIRRLVVSHAEAFTAEAVLTPAQIQRWKPAGFDPAPRLEGRYGLPPAESENIPPTGAECLEKFRSKARVSGGLNTSCSPLMRILDSRNNPNGTPRLSPAQVALVEQVDRLAADLRAAWVLRGLPTKLSPEEEMAPPPDDLAKRFARAERGFASLVAHAEALAMGAIATEGQAEAARRRLWSDVGVNSLLDPEMAARLDLNRQQRTAVLQRMTERNRVHREVSGQMANFGWGMSGVPGVDVEAEALERAREAQIAKEGKNLLNGADARVLGGLTPKQLRLYREIQGPASAAPEAPATKQPRAT